MLKTLQILNHCAKWLSSMVAVVLAGSLVFGSVPAQAWAQDFEESAEASQEIVGETESYSRSTVGDDSVSDESVSSYKVPSGDEASENPENDVCDSVNAPDGGATVREIDEGEEASLFYIDSKSIEVGEEQVVMFGFDEVVDAYRYVLSYSKIGGPSDLTCEAADVKPIDGETTVLFKLAFLDDSAIGDYRIDSVSWYGTDEGAYEAPVSDDGVSFSVVKASDCKEGITVTTLDDDGSVLETSDVADALEAADDEAVVSSVAPQAFSAVQGRSIANANGNLVIGLDPGHGGYDGGASSGGVAEKDLNLRIALACRDRLQQQGARVVMTRSDDRAVNLTDRASIAKNAGATVFVSFHINSAAAVASGYEVWVQNGNYKPELANESVGLADAVRSKLAQFGLGDRGNKPSYYNDPPKYYPDGSMADGLCVLRDSKNLGMPAILIEHGFINNSYDRNIMYSRAEEMGRADAEAIIDYYQIGGKLVHDGVGYRFQYPNGSFLKNSWMDINGRRYYFKSDGYAAQYCNTIDGNSYLFWSDCSLARNVIWGEKLYGADGAMVKGAWYDLNGRRYYAKDDGQLARYATEVGGKTYLFWSDHSLARNQIYCGVHYGLDGAMSVSAWVDFNGRRYYAKDDGQLAQYATQIGSKTYLFWSDFSLARNLWWNNHYYQSDGSMATNQWIGDVWVNADGVIDPSANDAIMGSSKVTATQMANEFIRTVGASAYPYADNPDAPNIQAFCNIYIQEAAVEGVRADVAFAQAMLETNWLRFTGRCTADQFNFAGMGAIDSDPSNKGAYFANIRTGIRAQIQHLKAYATDNDPLANPCVDPRFHLVKRGSAPIIQWLGIQENPQHTGWASGAGYGNKITRIMLQVEGK